MSTIEQLLNKLGNHRITLRYEKDNLVVNAPKGAMTAELAANIRERKTDLIQFLSSLGRQHAPIPKAPQDAPLRPSLPQQRLWFIEQLAGKDSLTPGQYNLYAALKLKGLVDFEALRMAIHRLGERHLPLRMRFLQKDGKPLPQMDPPEVLTLSFHNMEAFSTQDRWAALLQEAQFNFRIDQDCLCRFRVFRWSADEHVLMVNMHHIISDGWSMGILVRELMAFYAEMAHGQKAALPALPISYLDFAHWQDQPEQRERQRAQLAWWEEKLRDLPPLHQIPTDRPRMAVNRQRAKQVHRLIEKDLLEGLNLLGNQHGASLYMVLLAAFNLLLSRYSRCQDMVLGATVANRDRAELEPLIGFFVNTLVLRIAVNPEVPFTTFLAEVKRNTLTSFAHQEVPFDQVVDVVNPERALNYAPLVQIMFSQQNAPFSKLVFPGLSIEPLLIDTATSKFDLTLDTLICEEGLKTEWDFNLDLFDTETMETMAHHYETLLKAILKAPACPISDLDFSDDAERQKILVTWNQTQTESPAHIPVHQHFARWAALQPNHPAVISEGTHPTLTYEQLNRKANQLAWLLLDRGIKPEDRVGLHLDRSPKMLIAILATLKAGGTYVPLDPNLPQGRIANMLADSKPSLVLSEEPQAAGWDIPWIILTEPAFASFRDEDPNRPISPLQAAYLVYTSGSSGVPKAAVNTHLGLCNHALWQGHDFPLGPEDRIALKTPFSFDVSAFETFWALVNGATLVIAKPGMHGDPFYLRDFILRHRITGIHFVGSMLKAFLDSLSEDVLQTHLRVLHSGGEALTAETQRLVCKRLRGSEGLLAINNGYGPSETSITVTNARLPAIEILEDPAIGKPVPNTQLYVTSLDLKPEPLGVPGELLIGGISLGRGYFGRPALTAERFIPNPFSEERGQRLYRTGDLVRWRPDGSLRILGRLDHQVKLRGLRIELGEIEAAMGNLPAVDQAVVVLGTSHLGEKLLVAYVQTTSQDLPESVVMNWKNQLAQILPGYMIPSLIEPLRELPRLPSGKVNRKALQNQVVGVTASANRNVFVAPQTDLEVRLANIWETILQHQPVGLHDNFFELGGHSLLATQVISGIRESFQAEIPLPVLFQNPTLAGLVSWMTRHTTHILLPAITPRPNPLDPIPLSFAQQRLWFLDQLLQSEAHAAAAYNLHTHLKVTGSIDAHALQRAWQALVMRHESLRTYFQEVNGQPRQFIAEESHVPLIVHDARHFSETEIQRLVDQEAQFVFSLERPELVRTVLLQRGNCQADLLLTMHHIISDGWSMNLLVQEWAALYTEATGAGPASLPELAIQYADFALWQRTAEVTQDVERQAEWWQQQLAGLPSLHQLPTDRPRPRYQTQNGAALNFEIGPETSLALERCASESGATPFMVLLTAFKILLVKYSGQRDIVVGTPIANRNRRQLEPLIGFFVNTLVLRDFIDQDQSFRNLLQQVKASTLESFAHQDVPFEKIVDLLQPERQTSFTPLFQIMFAMQNQPNTALKLPDITLEPQSGATTAAKFDLSLDSWKTPTGWATEWRYNTDLFEGETIARMIEHFGRLLSLLLSHPDQRISQISLLTQQETLHHLTTINQAEMPLDHEKPMYHFVEEWARTHPERTAITQWDGETWTYAQLNANANRIAWHLRDLGVGHDARIAVFLDRSLAMIAAQLGILKAGAAYVPVDPENPEQRWSHILEDCQPHGILTNHLLSTRLGQRAHLCVEDLLTQETRTDNLSLPFSPEQGFFLIYTSGSSGKPKASVNTHRGIVHYNLWHQHTFPLKPEDRVGLKTPFGFDVASWETYWPLIAGANLIIAKPATSGDPFYLREWLNTFAVTAVYFVPSLLGAFLDSLGNQGFSSSLRYLFTGGEVLPAETQARVLKKMTGQAGPLEIHNMFGPSEASLRSAFYSCGTLPHKAPIPIGKSLANTKAFVLDPRSMLQPFGIPGELNVAGIHLSRGYLSKPRLTAEKFIPNPYATSLDDNRLYRTGDLVKRLPDCNLVYLGRVDSQVKLRGMRIELTEIESHIRNIDPECQVKVLLNSQDQDQHLVALIQTQRQDYEDFFAEIRDQLGKVLPAYMVPSRFIARKSFPLLPNEKLDMVTLQTLAKDAGFYAKGPAYVPPRNPIEATLCQIWQDVLGLKQVGIHDSFFEIGGHSLLATQILSRMREAFPEKLSLRYLFDKPTVAGIAEGITQIRKTLNPVPLHEDSSREAFEF